MRCIAELQKRNPGMGKEEVYKIVHNLDISCVSREYEKEIQHVALHMVSTAVSMWVFEKRVGKSVSGGTWPWHDAWKRNPNAYKIAVRGLAASRMRTLSVLLREVNRRDKPSLMDKVLPPRKEEEQSKTEKSRGMCGLCGGGSSSPRSPVGGKAAEEDEAEEQPELPTPEKLEAVSEAELVIHKSWSWLKYIQPARHPYEENARIDQTPDGVYLRITHDITPGCEILAWYSDTTLSKLGLDVFSERVNSLSPG